MYELYQIGDRVDVKGVPLSAETHGVVVNVGHTIEVQFDEDPVTLPYHPEDLYLIERPSGPW